jgi:hypothetical protein
MAKKRIKKPYWVISSKKKGAIWDFPYLKETDCLTEYRSQMAQLRKDKGDEYMKKVDWVIEQHWYEVEKDTVDDDFDNFA